VYVLARKRKYTLSAILWIAFILSAALLLGILTATWISLSQAKAQSQLACEDWPAAAEAITAERNMMAALHTQSEVRVGVLLREIAVLKKQIKELEEKLSK
jgi:uncharacterized protein YneF (UPF0154 family)